MSGLRDNVHSDRFHHSLDRGAHHPERHQPEPACNLRQIGGHQRGAVQRVGGLRPAYLRTAEVQDQPTTNAELRQQHWKADSDLLDLFPAGGGDDRRLSLRDLIGIAGTIPFIQPEKERIREADENPP